MSLVRPIISVRTGQSRRPIIRGPWQVQASNAPAAYGYRSLTVDHLASQRPVSYNAGGSTPTASGPGDADAVFLPGLPLIGEPVLSSLRGVSPNIRRVPSGALLQPCLAVPPRDAAAGADSLIHIHIARKATPSFLHRSHPFCYESSVTGFPYGYRTARHRDFTRYA